MKSTATRARSERGAELIEFALVFRLLLMVVLGIVDFGFLFQRMEVVTNAAREGARIAVLPGYLEADVRARVCNFVQTGGIPVTGACPKYMENQAPPPASCGTRMRCCVVLNVAWMSSEA